MPTFGQKLRVPVENFKKNPLAEDMAHMQLAHMIIEEMPMDYIRMLFKLKVINPNDTKTALKYMNPKMPEHLKVMYNELKNTEQIEMSASINLKIK